MQRVLRVLGPDGALTVIALVALAAAAASLGRALRIPTDTVVPYLAVAGALLATTAVVQSPLLVRDRRRFVASQARALRVWAPFVILYVCYRALRGVLLLIPAERDHSALLRRADEAIFGVSPAWWMQDLATPWLTELLALAYATMFVLPLVILVGLYARGHDHTLRRAALALLVGFYLGFVGFLVVPARSPDVVYAFDAPLQGHGFYEWSSAAWTRLQQVTYDAFPSMHTCTSTIALVLAHRHGALLVPAWPRLVVRAFWPVVILLQLATLYLRQHYFVDVAAGWVLAAVALALADRAIALWDRVAVPGTR